MVTELRDYHYVKLTLVHVKELINLPYSNVPLMFYVSKLKSISHANTKLIDIDN